MKAINKILLGLLLLVVASACQEEFDPGSTAAVGFAGEWYYQVQAPDGSVYADFDYEGDVLLTYGSAADVVDEIWIDDQDNWPFYSKAKFTITGSPESFVGDGFSVNEIAVDYYGEPAYPDEDGIEVIDTIDDYAATALVSGEILKGAAKVYADKEKAPTDSCRFVLIGAPARFFYVTREVEYHELDTTVTPIIDTTYNIYVLDRQEPFMEVLDTWADTVVYSGHKQTGWEVYL